MRRRMIGGQTVSNGIYILHINGKLYTRDKWIIRGETTPCEWR